MDAVSARKIRGPRLQDENPFAFAINISVFENPPSGPISMSILFGDLPVCISLIFRCDFSQKAILKSFSWDCSIIV